MTWFRNIKIQNKLFFAFGILVSLFIILAIFLVSKMDNVEDRYDRLLNESLQRQTCISNAMGDLTKIRIFNLSRGYLLMEDDELTTMILDSYKDYQNCAESFLQNLSDYRANLIESNDLSEPERRERLSMVTDIEEIFNDIYQQEINDLYDASRGGDMEKVRLTLSRTVPLGATLDDKLEEIQYKALIQSNERVAQAKAFSAESKRLAAVMAFCIVILAIIVSAFMSQIIKAPILGMETAMSEISKGNLTYPIRSAYNDELGRLSNRIGDMVDTISLRKEREEQQKQHEEEMHKALLAAEEASRAKSAFLANMSHEIRTPMNSILGFSELAMDDQISPKTKDYLKKITKSSEGLLQIINDILDISKIESGKAELEKTPFNLHEVFALCQSIIAPKAVEKGITLYCYAEPSIGKRLIGDPLRLRQVLINILSNAVKFTNSGVVKLLSSIESTTENSHTIYFEVKDSGIGMSPEQISRIFDPFMQADSSTTRKYGGTGLGLSISKNIIELMGGKLNVESASDIGSKFSFSLTFGIMDVPTDAPDIEVNVNELKKPTFKNEVLLCEDNSMNQQVICDHLLRVGITTVVAANGQEGVAIVKHRMENNEKPFDLIFMDIHMPVMDGLEAANKLKEMGNKTSIIAITANIMANDRGAYQEYGMIDCVAKPFTAHELWACLLKYLTPLTLKSENEDVQTAKDELLYTQLRIDFVKDNQNTFKNISAAIESDDIKLAHRLVHTLKSTAALIGKIRLQEVSYGVEKILAGGRKEKLTEEHMKALEIELQSALEELAPLLDKPEIQTTALTESFDRARTSELFETLESMLKTNNLGCLDLIDELNALPGGNNLAKQIKDFDFRCALATLADLKATLEV